MLDDYSKCIYWVFERGEGMLDFAIVLIVFILIFVIVIILVLSSKGKRSSLKNHPIPDHLGIQLEGFSTNSTSLRSIFDNSYIERVKDRVLKENPKWPDFEFEWTLFELKRYFVMNSLLKSVPMFSTRVDDIWHEMLMFTREYETFSKNFYHELLHHIPTNDPTPIPFERAFFDWIYLSLFESTPNSRAIWGGFLKNPIKREILDDFRQLSEEELLNKYFRTGDEWLNLKQSLIRKMKKEIFHSDDVKQGKKKLRCTSNSNRTTIFPISSWSSRFLFHLRRRSIPRTNAVSGIQVNITKSAQTGGGSTCSGFACSSDSDSGGNSGGSSCSSSCGGGCSS